VAPGEGGVIGALLAAGKAVLGAAAGIPWWVWPMVGLALLLSLQTLRLADAHADIAAEQLKAAAVERDVADYKTRIAAQAAVDNAKALDDLKAWQAMTEAAQAARLARLQSDNDDLNRRLEAIDHAPDDQDGAVAPVLCDSLVGLHLATGCTAAGAAAGG
jgi:hypothetical protein